mmetsp:Transcript_44341/g.86785  ORF Transcript_44341/g.86785 Transcript_44341/m.86785 type:complete len:540 (+) Transcript_44341:37-1656(+)|eukprot:CAMPEP_0175149418 /NCGR_PEP_ID=MMETSP0087-20121206/17237_1 /TAXON_ID=136419 /ORGANISM="Unknown Unknown, Strain D1" /LENGTH=539 /DNA_ID=CAMNT_0016435117 /DNA_START=29 /DNA_END=1648 /DNA_ORIENTATION=+
MTFGFLRVYFPDEAWVTIPANLDTPTQEIRQTILKKRNLIDDEDRNEYVLFMVDSSRVQGDGGYEKRLEPDEFPLEIQETLRKHGQLDSFKFVFKPSSKEEEKTGYGSGGGNSSDSNDDMFSSSRETKEKMVGGLPVKEGYLDKRGKRNKAWRERWFVLQNGCLYYFKSHTRNNAISHIPLADAAVRQYTEPGKSRDFLFEVVTSSRIFSLKALTFEDMMTWLQVLRQHSASREDYILDDISLWIEGVELAKATEQEKLVDVCSTLQGCLALPSARQSYREFVELNHMEENLLFWLDVQDYRDIDSAEERKAKGAAIVDKFVKSGASHEIGFVDAKSRVNVPQLVTEGVKSAFDELQLKTFMHMERQGWPQFKNSSQFRHCLLEVVNQASRGAADSLHFEDFALSAEANRSDQTAKSSQSKRQLIKANTKDDISDSSIIGSLESNSDKVIGGAKKVWKPKTIFDDSDEEEEVVRPQGHSAKENQASAGFDGGADSSLLGLADDADARVSDGEDKADTGGGLFDISDGDDDIDDLLAEYS